MSRMVTDGQAVLKGIKEKGDYRAYFSSAYPPAWEAPLECARRQGLVIRQDGRYILTEEGKAEYVRAGLAGCTCTN